MRKPVYSGPVSKETGLEIPGIPVQTGYGWKSLKICLIDSKFRTLPRLSHHVTVTVLEILLPPLGFFSLKIFFSQKALPGKTCDRTDKEGWKGKGGKSTRDGGNGGNCTGDTGWDTGVLFLVHWCTRAGVQGSSDDHLHTSGPRGT